ncbi:hypothetical protein N9A78_03765, partial [Akkermansiaceae bacterium]|nr:hypothetical protein [Akkermansiaceae bacterium]
RAHGGSVQGSDAKKVNTRKGYCSASEVAPRNGVKDLLMSSAGFFLPPDRLLAFGGITLSCVSWS